MLTMGSNKSVPYRSCNKSAPYHTTFEVATDKKLEKVKFTRKNENAPPLVTDLKSYKDAKAGQFIQGTKFSWKNSVPCQNSFVYSITEAYNRHHHIVIRPDDVWLAIMIQFSFYINKEAEKFRGQFVNFEGKKELEVYANGTLFSAPYEALVMMMETEIHKNLVDGEVRGWMMPGFSTTTASDRVVAGVVFMAVMKKYFDYKFCFECGIPKVTLDGTVEDWDNIRQRINKLDEYELGDWASLLKPILDQFVAAKKGNADKDFWNRICHYSGGGSGPTYLSGWISAFCYFDKDGKKIGSVLDGFDWPRIDTQDIPPGIVEVDVLVDDNGTQYKTVMLAGHMAREVGRDGVTIIPKTGWAICLKNEN